MDDVKNRVASTADEIQTLSKQATNDHDTIFLVIIFIHMCLRLTHHTLMIIISFYKLG